MLKVRFLLLLLILVVSGCSNRGTPLEDYLERSITLDDKKRGYRVFVPKDRDANKKVPVMLYLHGSGSRGDENREQAWAFDSAIGPVKDRVDFIVVLPQCRADLAWISD